jgi:hypothetical protein
MLKFSSAQLRAREADEFEYLEMALRFRFNEV